MASVSQRLEGLDIARFLAFVGMVIVNFNVVMGAENIETWSGWISSLFQGRAAATFVVLAGLGLGLSTQYKSLYKTQITTIKRAVFLLVIGTLNLMIFEADILHFYAFYFLFGAFFLNASNKTLVLSILIINLLALILIFLLDYEAGWNFNEMSYSGLWTSEGYIRHLIFNGWHPLIPWFGFVLYGIRLSRLSLQTKRVQIILSLSGLLIIALAELTSLYLQEFMSYIDKELVDLVTTETIPPMPLYFLAGLGWANTVLGLCLLITPYLSKVNITKPLALTGRQALTLYIAHIFIGMGIIEELDMLGGQSSETSITFALAFCGLCIVYAMVWSKFFKAGPLETLMRKLCR